MPIEHAVVLSGDGSSVEAWRYTTEAASIREFGDGPWRRTEKEARQDELGDSPSCPHPYEQLRRRSANARVLVCLGCDETLSAAPVVKIDMGE